MPTPIYQQKSYLAKEIFLNYFICNQSYKDYETLSKKFEI